MPKKWFVTNSLDSIYISNILAYSLNEQMEICVSSSKGILILSFSSLGDVYAKRPKIKLITEIPNNFINLKTDFFIIKYWKLVFLITCLIIVVLLLLVIGLYLLPKKDI